MNPGKSAKVCMREIRTSVCEIACTLGYNGDAGQLYAGNPSIKPYLPRHLNRDLELLRIHSKAFVHVQEIIRRENNTETLRKELNTAYKLIQELSNANDGLLSYIARFKGQQEVLKDLDMGNAELESMVESSLGSIPTDRYQ